MQTRSLRRKVDIPPYRFDSSFGYRTKGSVSAFEPGANLCLSAYELSRTSPKGLDAQVAALVAHEGIHLLGFGEELAVSVQKYVFENFDKPEIMKWKMAG